MPVPPQAARSTMSEAKFSGSSSAITTHRIGSAHSGMTAPASLSGSAFLEGET